ncbi:MAG: PRC-barrel domain-containing protein [Actinomycetota bacterium]|nr:PRC-barrel domain-containing protein [Actinomycetota bacterium]
MDVESLYGKLAFDVNGQELGVVDAVYLDKGTGEPEWVAVRTGRSETSLAPLAGATPGEGGVRLGVDAKLVRNAPHSDHPPGETTAELSEAQETELYLYYSVEYTSPTAEDPLLSTGPGASNPDPATS